VPLELVRGNPLVEAMIRTAGGKDLAGSFLVDTAWRSALSLNAPFVREHGLLGSTSTIEAITGVGVGGPTLEAVGRIAWLRLGSAMIEAPVTNFSRARAGILAQSDMTGIIGAEVLRRFTVTFDYSRKRMILQPNAHFGRPYEFDMSGTLVTSAGEDRETLRVHYLVENGPGAEAGLREGDVITAIDGQPAAGMSLDQVRRMFRQEPGKEYEIGLLRDGAQIVKRLRLRRMV
jgi:membrane-associated protease RseP (regulator of RpoE activity)